MTNLRHFTAWMINDRSMLDQPNMGVTILEDTLIGSDPDNEGHWATDSTKPMAFYAVTTVDARDGEGQDGVNEAMALMSAAGWDTVGKWEPTPSAYTATVEYTGAYRHVIEETHNAESPEWFEMARGDNAEEYDGDPEVYGRGVLADFWPVNGLETPKLTDEYGNPHFRILVRTQDDGYTLATVDSSALNGGDKQ